MHSILYSNIYEILVLRHFVIMRHSASIDMIDLLEIGWFQFLQFCAGQTLGKNPSIEHGLSSGTHMVALVQIDLTWQLHSHHGLNAWNWNSNLTLLCWISNLNQHAQQIQIFIRPICLESVVRGGPLIIRGRLGQNQEEKTHRPSSEEKRHGQSYDHHMMPRK